LQRHVAARWPKRAPDDLERSDVAELHREIGKDTPVEANRVIETIRKMYNFGQDEGIVEDGFNPASRVNKFEEQSRDRWVRPHEVSKLADAIDNIGNPYLENYYWLLMLTATRRNEMLEAKWDHVDLQRKELFLPDTKNGKDHTVPLSSAAVDKLEELDPQKNNPWLFCSHIPGQRIKEVNQRWRRVRKEAGLEDVQLHDLRRTAASWLGQAGYSELIIKKLLNHSFRGVTKVYTHLPPDAVRDAVEWYGEKLMSAAEGTLRLSDIQKNWRKRMHRE
jgi:integrase